MGESGESFRILVATDNHLGYAEKHPERGNDSFEAFEEVLELAVEHDVDFILLGGDLFHENRPSRHCQVRCMDLLRKYTFGDRAVNFNILSDPAINFPHTKQVNYLDPNLNVAIPVFSIHGNHDDPAGLGFLCALEMLSSAGLINYFGRVLDMSDVKISPILLEKGNTKLAVYGMSSVKDERLHRLFVENKVKMLRPKESTTEWFNLMVLHQNRAKRGPSNYLPESFLDPFLDLIIWGHEHDCIREPWHSSQNFHVLQPGSSVVTSLSPGEAIEKCVFLLQVNDHHQFKVDPLPLKTVRPFVFEEVVLADINIAEEVKRIKKKNLDKEEKVNKDKEESALDKLMKARSQEVSKKGRGGRGAKANKDTDDDDDTEKAKKEENPVQILIEQRVLDLIKRAKKLLTGHPRQPILPLIRVRVIYSDEAQLFNVCRFGCKFDGMVANTEDLVIFNRHKIDMKPGDERSSSPDIGANLINVDDVHNTVEDLVEQIFKDNTSPEGEMRLLTERGMGAAITAFVHKDDKNAVSAMIDYQVQRMEEHILSLDKDYDDPEELEADIKAFRLKRSTDPKLVKEEEEVMSALSKNKKRSDNNASADLSDGDIDMDSTEDSDGDGDGTSDSVPPTRGRGSRGRGSRGPRGGRGSRGRAALKLCKYARHAWEPLHGGQ
ncbi:Double-strand break repair protein MRE11 [Chionoecetes opilio]|uniref:Double-strand break repair protein n=1 Tax=Chionoecetes opilio TaxID=41210 RepID=A0A8J4YBM0_CHIOP|nr:Double-strand break repair protein MRE11 [Chionoecetes opilio]